MATTAGLKRKTTSAKSKGGYDVPWVEKYRPRSLSSVVGNEDTVVRLQAISEDGNMPNLNCPRHCRFYCRGGLLDADCTDAGAGVGRR